MSNIKEAEEQTGISRATVSYTHLDVYKRQVKHVVEYYGGYIEIHSKMEEGTEIVVHL